MTDQLRANRRQAVQGWLSGGATGADRWEGDDGRTLSPTDIMWMKLRLADGGLAEDVVTAYTKIVNAQQVEFDRVDAIYESEKALL